MLAGSGHQAGSFVGCHGAGGAPEDLSLTIHEQGDDLFLVGDLEILQKLVAIDEERHDPVHGFRIGLVGAQRGCIPPAEDEVLAAEDRQLVIVKLEAGMLQGLAGGEPGVDVLLLLGLKRNEEQVGLALEAAGYVHLLLIEGVAGDGREDRGFGLRGVEDGQQREEKQRDQKWRTLPQKSSKQSSLQDRENLEAWYHPR